MMKLKQNLYETGSSETGFSLVGREGRKNLSGSLRLLRTDGFVNERRKSWRVSAEGVLLYWHSIKVPTLIFVPTRVHNRVGWSRVDDWMDVCRFPTPPRVRPCPSGSRRSKLPPRGGNASPSGSQPSRMGRHGQPDVHFPGSEYLPAVPVRWPGCGIERSHRPLFLFVALRSDTLASS